jgi:hypothetical protein
MKPNCNQCKHYFITYDKHTPRGCKAYGIKSQQLPSMVVKSANNGRDCIGFELKDSLKNQKKEKDLNDPTLW